MNSCTWNASVSRSSFSGSHGSATSRTTTRWLPTPRKTCLVFTPALPSASRRASATGPGSRTSPASTAPGVTGTWAARTTTGMSPAATSATRIAVDPMSTPTLVRAISGPLHLHGSVRQVGVHVGLPDPVVLADAQRRELPGLDQPVDGHVRDPHRRRDLSDGEQAVARLPAGPSLARPSTHRRSCL